MGQWKLISGLAARKRTKNNFRLSRNADFPVFLLTPTMERINIEHCQKPCFGTKIQCHLLHVQGLCLALCFKKCISQWNVISKWKSEMFCLETVEIKHSDWKKGSPPFLKPEPFTELNVHLQMDSGALKIEVPSPPADSKGRNSLFLNWSAFVLEAL